MEITPQSKLFDVIEAYPHLEEQIMGIAPPFKNLKNPLLRRTIGRLATIEKAAQIGGIDANELVNILRRAAGQEEREVPASTSPVVEDSIIAPEPDWLAGEPQFTVDGTELLRQNQVPLVRVNELLEKLAPGRHLLLVTDFEPTPILDAMRQQNKRMFYQRDPEDPNRHLTRIQ